ncbi:hypothetical protein DPMN_114050 [Dreissena polymorpha]|uniref:Uncharacterized protein n=1 Tax=Dreissena polymorpha TaxID=45954 RepID=A0A9D4QRL9_DREPO|nr:hypothetical protein DPMN_114050 [Dreissena polymorpha]
MIFHSLDHKFQYKYLKHWFFGAGLVAPRRSVSLGLAEVAAAWATAHVMRIHALHLGAAATTNNKYYFIALTRPMACGITTPETIVICL